MKKKYLTTIEEILALRDTDTKIYKDNATGYFKFVEGVPCFFNTDSLYLFYNCTIDFSQKDSKLYIEVEEPGEEVTKKDIGCLCAFWDFHKDDKQVGVLVSLDSDACPYHDGYTYYQHCRRLTPTEVAEITGYKVEE